MVYHAARACAGDPAARSDLVQALGLPSQLAREQVLPALGRQRAREAVPALLALYDRVRLSTSKHIDPESILRVAPLAGLELEYCELSHGRPGLWADDGGWTVEDDVVKALLQIGVDQEVLRRWATSRMAPRLREVLAQLDLEQPHSWEVLRRLLREPPEPYTRSEVIRALAARGGERSVQVLQEFLDDPAQQAGALECLERLEDGETRLLARLKLRPGPVHDAVARLTR